jgi:DNA-binding LacI/PurR family transcriptional regulator
MEEIRRCATELREHGVDGFIVILPTAQKLKALETVFGESPVVVMGTSRHHRYTAVEIDHEIGSRHATEYLISEGHREIACVSGPLDWECSNLRRRGWANSKKTRCQDASAGESIAPACPWSRR